MRTFTLLLVLFVFYPYQAGAQTAPAPESRIVLIDRPELTPEIIQERLNNGEWGVRRSHIIKSGGKTRFCLTERFVAPFINPLSSRTDSDFCLLAPLEFRGGDPELDYVAITIYDNIKLQNRNSTGFLDDDEMVIVSDYNTSDYVWMSWVGDDPIINRIISELYATNFGPYQKAQEAQAEE